MIWVRSLRYKFPYLYDSEGYIPLEVLNSSDKRADYNVFPSLKQHSLA